VALLLLSFFGYRLRSSDTKANTILKQRTGDCETSISVPGKLLTPAFLTYVVSTMLFSVFRVLAFRPLTRRLSGGRQGQHSDATDKAIVATTRYCPRENYGQH
jgi:hypothetical protein